MFRGQSKSYDLWIDRFDVRVLLLQYTEFQKVLSIADKEDDSNTELLFERYQDLVDTSEDDIYLSENLITRNIAPYVREEDEPFRVPEYADFPKDMIFPRSQKAFEVIVRTAKSARENRQLEVVLKVKQNGNPAFGFLNEDSNLNRLYKVDSFSVKRY